MQNVLYALQSQTSQTQSSTQSEPKDTTALSVTWQGAWLKGMPNGRGSLVFKFGGRHEGTFVDGLQDGFWIEHRADGSKAEGEYLEGKKHGPWKEEPLPLGTKFMGSYFRGRRVDHRDETMYVQ